MADEKGYERLTDKGYPNLIRPTHEQAVAAGKKGAAVANAVMAKRKSYKAVINEILAMSISEAGRGSKEFVELAKEKGIDLDTSVREFQVLQAFLEYLKRPNIWALEKFVQLSGEAGMNDGTMDKLDEILKAIDKKAVDNGTNGKAD